MALADALAPLLGLDPRAWRGLPDARPEEFTELFGPPRESGEATLGWYPAERTVYTTGAPAGDLVVWSRGLSVVAVDTGTAPSAEALSALPAPDSEFEGETLVPGASVDERLYLSRGLVLTVARPLDDDAGPERVLRMRGIRPLSVASEYGPDYYQSFADQIRWRGAGDG